MSRVLVVLSRGAASGAGAVLPSMVRLVDASDVIALTSVVAGSVVALGGLAAGYVSGAKDRTQAVEMAERDRLQARLESTYVELLTFAEEVGMGWAQMVLPMVGGDPDNPTAGLPEMPDIKTEAAVRAKTAAFASDEVRQALDAWRQVLRDIRAKVMLIQLRASRSDLGRPGPGDEEFDWTAVWGELETESRPAEQKARAELQRIAARELRALRH